ncbi:glutaredoxin 3 [Sphingomonas sabuli]|uniref:Glutaredoxin n=1 Tax=Sphingomonas sabuli TaxID=2764186 RepID=A0A7G9L233_9SPHN|nr:glutaredoxin 3 [Sphingomonas sabuli]QNM82682.1 glutaredoxin 3 [Sphingomonas sabuli]
MAKVEIYSKTYCGFCVRAKSLLEAKGIAFDEINIDGGGPRRDEMIQRANGRTTVPQIFIDGRHVGGCTDLFALDREGELDGMLARP